MSVLVVGATGSVGQLVVEEAIRLGCSVRALVRNSGKAHKLPRAARVVVGDVTRPETLTDAVDGVDAVVFTLGSDGAGKRRAAGVLRRYRDGRFVSAGGHQYRVVPSDTVPANRKA